ncbi:hypothetical protein GCM10010348_39590 [Streptomyces anthocyanicus]|nr:hypothetical protein GCM10010348_39590 [Streptomyces anthocyanicus]
MRRGGRSGPGGGSTRTTEDTARSDARAGSRCAKERPAAPAPTTTMSASSTPASFPSVRPPVRSGAAEYSARRRPRPYGALNGATRAPGRDGGTVGRVTAGRATAGGRTAGRASAGRVTAGREPAPAASYRKRRGKA